MKRFPLLLLAITSSLTGFSSDINVDSANFYFKKAINFSSHQKVWEADKSFIKALKFNPENKEIRIEYGNYLVNQRKFFVAIEQFGKVLESDINDLTALQKMAEISLLLRRWNDVIIYSKKIYGQNKDGETAYMLAKSYYELENYGLAKQYLNETLLAEPTNITAVTLLGKVLIELSDYKQAVAVYNKTLQLNPNNKQLIYELGLLHYTLGNQKEAVKYFELAAEKGFKTDLNYSENLGLALLSFDVERGVKVLNTVLENKPGNPEILFQVAQAYFKTEKFEAAANTYLKIFENDPSHTRALFMTGVAYQKMGDKNKGVAYCEQAIRLDPTLAQFRSAQPTF